MGDECIDGAAWCVDRNSSQSLLRIEQVVEFELKDEVRTKMTRTLTQLVFSNVWKLHLQPRRDMRRSSSRRILVFFHERLWISALTLRTRLICDLEAF